VNVVYNIRYEAASAAERPEVALSKLAQELDMPPAGRVRRRGQGPVSTVTSQLEDLMR
jgi:hypothetical protein